MQSVVEVFALWWWWLVFFFFYYWFFFFSSFSVTGGLFQSGVCRDQLTACKRRADFKADEAISEGNAWKEREDEEDSTVGGTSPQPPSAAAAAAASQSQLSPQRLLLTDYSPHAAA